MLERHLHPRGPVFLCFFILLRLLKTMSSLRVWIEAIARPLIMAGEAIFVFSLVWRKKDIRILQNDRASAPERKGKDPRANFPSIFSDFHLLFRPIEKQISLFFLHLRSLRAPPVDYFSPLCSLSPATTSCLPTFFFLSCFWQ